MARVRRSNSSRRRPIPVITWDEAVDNGGIASYDIHVNGALYTTVAGTVTLTVLTGLSPATSVTVSVFARDLSDNLSEEAISLTFMTGEPDVPTWPGNTSLDALSVSPNEVTLSWGMPNTDVAVTTFQIYVKDSLTASVPYPENEVTVGDLVPESTLTFRVEALGLTGLESTSGPALTLTTPRLKLPSGATQPKSLGLQSRRNHHSELDGSPFRHDDLSHFCGRRRIPGGGCPGQWGYDRGPRGPHPVRFIEAAGPSGLLSTNGPSAEVVTLDTTSEFPLGAQLLAGPVGQNTAEVSWTEATDQGGVVAHRLVDLASGNVLGTAAGEQTTTALINLTANTVYSVQLEAGDSAGNWSTGGPTTSSQPPVGWKPVTIPRFSRSAGAATLENSSA